MSKPFVTMAAIGGAFVLVSGAMVYFVWMALEAKTAAREGDVDGSKGYDVIVSEVSSLSKKPIYPSDENIKELVAQKDAFAKWQEEAMQLAVRGDRSYAQTSAAAFKEFLMNDAKRLTQLPGGVDGMLTQPEFGYGPFREYITEGKLPSDEQLPTLQRQWDDVATVVELIAKGGINEVTDVQIKPQEKPKEEPKAPRGPKGKKKQKKVEKTPEELAKVSATSWTYVLNFTTRPSGFVKALNSLATCERFIVVDDFAITRIGDMIQDVITAEKKKEDGGGRRRGRRSAVIDEEVDKDLDPKLLAAKKRGIVTDPELEAPVMVALTFTVYDFGTLDEEEGKK